jgi:GcrA cell cycle regulator
MAPNTTWTPAEIETITQMWLAGKSASVIGYELHKTRSAIIGKIHRLGVQRTEDVEKKVRGVPRKRKQPKLKPIKIDPKLIADAKWVHEDDATRSTRCSIYELTHEMCRFPIGDPAEESFAFCGAARIGTLSYCGFHANRCYRK